MQKTQLSMMILLLSLPVIVSAEEIIYDGSNKDVLSGGSGWDEPNHFIGKNETGGNTITLNTTKRINRMMGSYFKLETTDPRSVEIKGNKVKIMEGNIFGSSGAAGTVSGAYAEASAHHPSFAHDNSVHIETGTVRRYVYGAWLGGGDASKNSVMVKNVDIANNEYPAGLIGAYTGNGKVTDNTVTMENGNILGSVTGGNALRGIAKGNKVNISGGTINTTGGSIPYAVAGGDADGGEALENQVLISGGEFNGTVMGGRTAIGIASNNTVEITGGEFSGNIYGGISEKSDVEVGIDEVKKELGEANTNTVLLRGGAFNKEIDIYGGFSKDDMAIDNTVVVGIDDHTVSQPVVELDKVKLIGGGTLKTDEEKNKILASLPEDLRLKYSKDILKGNKLVINQKGNKVRALENFSEYQFNLPNDIQKNDVILQILDETVAISRADVSARIGTPNAPLQAGEEITLMQADKGFDTDSFKKSVAIQHGTTIVSRGVACLKKGSSALTLNSGEADTCPEPTGASTTDNTGDTAGGTTDNGSNDKGGNERPLVVLNGTKMIPQSRLATLSMVTKNINATDYILDDQSNIQAFAKIHGSKDKYSNEYHTKTSAMTLYMGLGYHDNITDSSTYKIATYLERGTGNYDLQENEGNYSHSGEGRATYYGAGINSQLNFNNGIFTGLGLRAGKVNSKLNKTSLTDTKGDELNFATNSMYLGAIAELGYKMVLTEQINLNLFGKFAWLKLAGKDVTAATGDELHLDVVNSKKLESGVKFVYALPDRSHFYTSLTYEYELDAKAKAKSYGHELNSVNLKGGTGVIQIGLGHHFSNKKNLFIDFNAKGYTGKRQGIAGSFELTNAF